MRSRSLVVPPGLFDSRQYGFAQVAVVSTPRGRAVHVSGQVAWDADQNIVGPGDVGRQLEQSLDNLAAALASVGASLDQVGALSLYIKQSHIADRGRARGCLSRRQRRRAALIAIKEWQPGQTTSPSCWRPFDVRPSLYMGMQRHLCSCPSQTNR